MPHYLMPLCQPHLSTSPSAHLPIPCVTSVKCTANIHQVHSTLPVHAHPWAFPCPSPGPHTILGLWSLSQQDNSRLGFGPSQPCQVSPLPSWAHLWPKPIPTCVPVPPQGDSTPKVCTTVPDRLPVLGNTGWDQVARACPELPMGTPNTLVLQGAPGPSSHAVSLSGRELFHPFKKIVVVFSFCLFLTFCIQAVFLAQAWTLEMNLSKTTENKTILHSKIVFALVNVLTKRPTFKKERNSREHKRHRNSL